MPTPGWRSETDYETGDAVARLVQVGPEDPTAVHLVSRSLATFFARLARADLADRAV
jgi:hypothetical protein